MTNKMAPATVEPAKLRIFFQTNPTRKHATMLDGTNNGYYVLTDCVTY